jgi:hypothetical protein
LLTQNFRPNNPNSDKNPAKKNGSKGSDGEQEPGLKKGSYFRKETDLKDLESEIDALYDTSIRLGEKYQAPIPDLDLSYGKSKK